MSVTLTAYAGALPNNASTLHFHEIFIPRLHLGQGIFSLVPAIKMSSPSQKSQVEVEGIGFLFSLISAAIIFSTMIGVGAAIFFFCSRMYL